MKLTVLTDNVAGRNCLAEFGLSYLIEADKKVLLDTGNSDVFRINASRLNLSLDDVDAVVLSHGHWDHGNGLKHFGNKPLITHPASFSRRYNKKDNSYIGIDQSFEDLSGRYRLIISQGLHEISPEITFLGEIPRKNDFEARHTHFMFEDGSDDYVLDDSALMIRTSNGLVIVSGCAHAGICNTVEYACEVAETNKVSAVIGGFHLKNEPEITQKTMEYLKRKGVKHIHPSHCTSLPALAAFHREFNIFQVLTGDYFYF